MLPLLLVSAALAQDPDFDRDVNTLPAGEEEEPPDRDAHFKAGLGGVFGTGNARFLTLTTSLDGKLRVRRNQVTLVGSSQYASAVVDQDADGTVANDKGTLTLNSQVVQGQLRYDRFLSDRDSLYALAGGLHDPFKGLAGRANARVGYGRHVLDAEKLDVQAALGADVAREWYTPSAAAETGIERNDVVAAMIYEKLEWQISENSALSEEVETLLNVADPEDVRINARAGLTSSISSVFSTQIAVELRYDNVPAAPSFAKTDVVTTVALVASLL